jgi:hypothetical protein
MCGLAAGGTVSGAAAALALAGGVDDNVLAGWPAALVGYPAAVSVPLAFITMVLVSKVTRAPDDTSRIFARMHVPERLGMGVERVPRG